MRTESFRKFISLTLLLAWAVIACQPVPAAVEPTPAPTATFTPEVTLPPVPLGFVEYFSQSGDTLKTVASHFGVELAEIRAPAGYDPELLLDPGTRLLVRDVLGETTPPARLFPDSDVVYSPSAIGFDMPKYLAFWNGYLADYEELMTRGMTPGHEILQQLAIGHSINPRILLTMMEFASGWVTHNNLPKDEIFYPMGYVHPDRGGLFDQTVWAVRQLNIGYYGWRAGTLSQLTFSDGTTLRLSPFLNAGTVAVMYALAQIHTYDEWKKALYGDGNMVTVHHLLFDDPWERASTVEPLFPAGTSQPELNLPFLPNQRWALTNGPHPAWGLYGPRAALDFAPAGSSGCDVSRRFTTAAAAGRVVRDGDGLVVLDLDSDGYEQTGWVLVYMHVSNTNRVALGDDVRQDDPLGHPSCAGGPATGAHVHITRKFNGEWVLADGGIPFVLSGYRAYDGARDCFGDRFCQGYLDNGERVVTADAYANAGTNILRPDSRPEFFYTPTPRK